MRTHGKPGTYTAGCRCDACREAWRDYRADRPRPVPLSVREFIDTDVDMPHVAVDRG